MCCLQNFVQNATWLTPDCFFFVWNIFHSRSECLNSLDVKWHTKETRIDFSQPKSHHLFAAQRKIKILQLLYSCIYIKYKSHDCVCMLVVFTQTLGFIFNSNVITKPIFKWHLLIQILWFAIQTKTSSVLWRTNSSLMFHNIYLMSDCQVPPTRQFSSTPSFKHCLKSQFSTSPNKSWSAPILTNWVRLWGYSLIAIFQLLYLYVYKNKAIRNGISVYMLLNKRVCAYSSRCFSILFRISIFGAWTCWCIAWISTISTCRWIN